MGVSLKVVDLDAMFNQQPFEPLLVNDFDINTAESREEFNRKILTHYDGDMMSEIPSCDCGDLKDEYNIGKRCQECGTEVAHVTERRLEASVWIGCPKGVNTLINPTAWTLLSNSFSEGNFNFIQWLADPDYRPPKKQSANIAKFKRLAFKRGLNHFYENFDDIIDKMFAAKLYKGTGVDARQDLRAFIDRYRDRIFCQHIPIPSKVCFVTEWSANATYTDATIYEAVNAMRTISSLNNSYKPITQRKAEHAAVVAISQMAAFYQKTFRDTLAKKPGWFRKHIYGSRLHFSYRGVITSLACNHRYDELHLPWSMSVNLLKTHITNKLLRTGLSPRECSDFIVRHTKRYHPELDQIFQELIAEAPTMGLPVILLRNPTLARLSMQHFYLTKIKPDVGDLSISMSVLCLSGPNAD